MEDFHHIQETISCLTSYIISEVNWDYLRPMIMDIFPRTTIARAEGRDRASCDIMIKLCDSVSSLSTQDFYRFVNAIAIDHPHVAKEIQKKFKEKAGRIIPIPALQSQIAQESGRPSPQQQSLTTTISQRSQISTPSGQGEQPSQSMYCRVVNSSSKTKVFPKSPTVLSGTAWSNTSGFSDLQHPMNSLGNTQSTTSLKPPYIAQELEMKQPTLSIPPLPNTYEEAGVPSTGFTQLSGSGRGIPGEPQSGFPETNAPSSGLLYSSTIAQPCQYQSITGDASRNSQPHAHLSTIEQIRSPTQDHIAMPVPFVGAEVQGSIQASQSSKYEKAYSKRPTEVYKMNSEPRGHCLIIGNHKFEYLRHRPGTEKDLENLHVMFQEFLGFQVTLEQDRTVQEMKDALERFSRSPKLRKVDALAVVILTHGSENDILFGVDGHHQDNTNVIRKTDIQRIFNSSNCPAMREKPKVFILQACRGNETDTPQNAKTAMPQPSTTQHLQKDSVDYGQVTSDSVTGAQGGCLADVTDMCFFFSSASGLPFDLAGYQAYRRISSGSPVLNRFIECVKQYAHERHFYDIIQKVQDHFASQTIGQYMTTPEISLLRFKKWYLNPPVCQMQQS